MEFLVDIVHLKAKKLQIPLDIQFDLTYRCHQRCLHCYLPEAWRRGEGPGRELNTGEVIGILEQLAAAGTFFLNFSGGEVFLRDDLFTILEHARRLNFATSLMSSGTLGLDEARIDRLRDLGVGHLMVSMYGAAAAVHDRITGSPGSFSRVCRTIQSCHTRGIHLVFNFLAMSLNYKEFPAVREFADRYGIHIRVADELDACWDGRPHPPALSLTDEALREFDQLHEALAKRKDPATVPAELEFEEVGCNAAFTSAYISPQGEVRPCLDIPWPCGNLARERFLDIWKDSDGLNWVRQAQTQGLPGGGRVCDYFRRIRQKQQWLPQT